MVSFALPAAALAVAFSLFVPPSAVPSAEPSSTPSSTPSAAPAETPAAPEPEVRTLGNGLRVVVVVDRSAPIARVATYYRFGSAYEKKGKTGLAHALEHMMFRGTPSLSAAGLDDIDAQLGADVNAQTTTESTSFYFDVPADRVPLALSIEADRMQHLTLAAADWDVERKAVLHEWDGDHESSFLSLFYDVNAAIYPHSALGKPALGEREDIERATVADLRDYYRTWYVPNNATIVVTGDVDPSAVFAQAAAAFRGVRAKALPPSPIVVPSPASGATVNETSTFPIEIDDVAYAIPGNSRGNEADVERILMFVTALDSPRSILRKALVENGLTLGYFVYPAFDRHVGVVHALLVVSPGRDGADARAAFAAAMQLIVEKGISSELFDAAKRSRASSLDFARDSLPLYAAGVGGSYAFPGDATLAQSRATIAATTLADVNAAAKRYFSQPNALGIVSPHGNDLSKFKPPSTLSGAIDDSFKDRVPSGPVIEPPAIRASLAKPLTFANTIHPVDLSLPNGIHVLLAENHANPTVVVAGSFASSPAFDPPGKEGVGELLSAALATGSAKYDFTAQQQVAERLGAFIRFGSTFGAHAYSKDLGSVLDVLADDVRAPALPASRLAVLRAQVLAAAKPMQTLESVRAEHAFARALYPPGDPQTRFVSPESAAAITDDDVRAYATHYLRPDLLTIAIVGDVTPDQARTALDASFGSWTATGPRPNPDLPSIPLPEHTRELVHSLGGGVSVMLGQPAPPLSSPDYDTFALMNSMLGSGSFDSRLFRELREKRGLVYGVSSRLDSQARRGVMTIEFTTSPQDEEEAIAGVRAELLRLQRETVSPRELDRARTKLAAATILAEESSDDIASRLVDLGRFGRPLDYFDTITERYRKVTAADVKRVAREWLFPRDLVEVRTGP